jgi:hypothetical protein
VSYLLHSLPQVYAEFFLFNWLFTAGRLDFFMDNQWTKQPYQCTDYFVIVCKKNHAWRNHGVTNDGARSLGILLALLFYLHFFFAGPAATLFPSLPPDDVSRADEVTITHAPTPS